MPCEADVLSKNKLSIVADIPTGRQRGFCFTSKIWAFASREPQIPSFVRPESDPAAKSRIFKTILCNVPGFGTRGERGILHFDGVIKPTQPTGHRNPARVARPPDHWIEGVVPLRVRCIDEIQRCIARVLVLNRSHI